MAKDRVMLNRISCFQLQEVLLPILTSKRSGFPLCHWLFSLPFLTLLQFILSSFLPFSCIIIFLLDFCKDRLSLNNADSKKKEKKNGKKRNKKAFHSSHKLKKHQMCTSLSRVQPLALGWCFNNQPVKGRLCSHNWQVPHHINASKASDSNIKFHQLQQMQLYKTFSLWLMEEITSLEMCQDLKLHLKKLARKRKF